jgi:lysozyme family protein
MKTLEQALTEIGFYDNYPKAFIVALPFVLAHETEFQKGKYGDYDFVRTENVSGDSGGATKYGIDKASHRSVNIPNLTLSDAVEIYWDEWQNHKLDRLPEKLAVAAFDVWVNGGHADLWLQQAYNANCDAGQRIAEDGDIGPKTIEALKSCDEEAVLKSFLGLRQDRYNRLAQRDSLAKFLAGWTKRNDDLGELLA